jgi:hypothetical protein
MDVKNTLFFEKGMIIKPRNNPKVNRQMGRGGFPSWRIPFSPSIIYEASWIPFAISYYPP